MKNQEQLISELNEQLHTLRKTDDAFFALSALGLDKMPRQYYSLRNKAFKAAGKAAKALRKLNPELPKNIAEWEEADIAGLDCSDWDPINALL